MSLLITDILTATECPSCGVQFAMPDNMLSAKREGGGTFYCPNGHSLSWKKTDADRLRDELATAKTALLREREAAEQARRQVAATKGQLTKAKKRAAAALCPCCNRSFVQMRRHLEAKHPEYSGEVLEHANT